MLSAVTNSGPWEHCKNILCIRADNIGDVLMSVPAIRAVSQRFNARITLLTSSMARPVTSLISEIDEVIVYDLPWVKKSASHDKPDLSPIISELKAGAFDAAIIFTVFSQNPQPAAMLAYMAGIPKVLAYCRENPYELITDWLPDKEPYSLIQHQVRRDLKLVAAIGADITQEEIVLTIPADAVRRMYDKLQSLGVKVNQPWLVIHPGVSEEKRKYKAENWIAIGHKLLAAGYQLVITGTEKEKVITEPLAAAVGEGAFSFAGIFDFSEFAALIKISSLVISVNTATIHVAAATKTPVIVLYALSNPQHLPWKARGKYFLFEIPAAMRSRNEVLRFVHEKTDQHSVTEFTPEDVYQAALSILRAPETPELFPELPDLRKEQLSSL